jgi:hypothetical protein
MKPNYFKQVENKKPNPQKKLEALARRLKAKLKGKK